MVSAPEYCLARALIAHLRQQGELAESVLPEPWDRADQNQNLALSAAQYGLAVAVCPQPPAMVSEGATDSGFLQARVAVVILTTPAAAAPWHGEAGTPAASVMALPELSTAAEQLSALTTPQVQEKTSAEAQAAAAGLVMAACMGWDFQARGIPYASPRLLEVAPLDTSGLASFENLLGSSLTLGWRVHYKSYYARG